MRPRWAGARVREEQEDDALEQVAHGVLERERERQDHRGHHRPRGAQVHLRRAQGLRPRAGSKGCRVSGLHEAAAAMPGRPSRRAARRSYRIIEFKKKIF